MQGELDIACVPANLASVLYNRTDGGVEQTGYKPYLRILLYKV